LKKFDDEIQELVKKLVGAAISLHRDVSANFRKTAQNFHYEVSNIHSSSLKDLTIGIITFLIDLISLKRFDCFASYSLISGISVMSSKGY
jgi:hypothetical protein